MVDTTAARSCRSCFNPTLVRFCRIGPPQTPKTENVSIPPWFDFALVLLPFLVAPLSAFQSHLGSILPLQGAARAASRRGFNPTLVRFCQRRKEGNAQQSRWFQSHLGSILPFAKCEMVSWWHQFQSHLGSILPRRPRISTSFQLMFQSHLGSILPHCYTCDSVSQPSFQSHLGSILPCITDTLGERRSRFQSHLGSILPKRG